MYKVLIADDHTMLREGIRSMISRIKNVKVIDEASSGQETIEKFKQHLPDLLILDISLPDKNGMEVAKDILTYQPQAKIIVLSMFDDEEYINTCLELDIKGYVIKNESVSELETAIQTVMEGKNYYSSQVQKVIFRRHTQSLNKPKQPEITYKLTKREVEIVKLISEGLTSQEMADKLFISPRTVETHRANLLKKMEVKNAIELIKKVQTYNIIR